MSWVARLGPMVLHSLSAFCAHTKMRHRLYNYKGLATANWNSWLVYLQNMMQNKKSEPRSTCALQVHQLANELNTSSQICLAPRLARMRIPTILGASALPLITALDRYDSSGPSDYHTACRGGNHSRRQYQLVGIHKPLTINLDSSNLYFWNEWNHEWKIQKKGSSNSLQPYSSFWYHDCKRKRV